MNLPNKSLYIRVDPNFRVFAKFGILIRSMRFLCTPGNPKIPIIAKSDGLRYKSEYAPIRVCIRVGPNFSRFVKILAFSNSVNEVPMYPREPKNTIKRETRRPSLKCEFVP